MKFITNPGFINVVSLLKFFDNALADVAEWSDIVGENLYFYWHRSSSLSPNNRWFAVYQQSKSHSVSHKRAIDHHLIYLSHFRRTETLHRK